MKEERCKHSHGPRHVPGDVGRLSNQEMLFLIYAETTTKRMNTAMDQSKNPCIHSNIKKNFSVSVHFVKESSICAAFCIKLYYIVTK